jgi:hypothetical protein
MNISFLINLKCIFFIEIVNLVLIHDYYNTYNIDWKFMNYVNLVKSMVKSGQNYWKGAGKTNTIAKI